MIATVKGEKPLSDQLIELREENAAILERLKSRDVTITESHELIHQLQDKETADLHKLGSLNEELSMLRPQAAAASATAQRLQDMESLSVSMTEEMNNMQRSLTASQDALLHRDETITKLEGSLESSRGELGIATSAISRLKTEKSEYESRAQLRYDNMKDQLEDAAKGARKILANEHLSLVEKLKHQKMVADTKLKDTIYELEILKVDHANEVC